LLECLRNLLDVLCSAKETQCKFKLFQTLALTLHPTDLGFETLAVAWQPIV